MITITISANTIEELREELKKAQGVIEGQNNELPKLNENFKLTPRGNKKFTEFELNFITENYQSKKIPWIAGKLFRPKEEIYRKLNEMYKKGLPKKNNCVKTL